MVNIYDKKAASALKGVAIILLLWLHTFQTESLFGDYGLNSLPISNSLMYRMSLYSAQCLSLFAFATGYGLYLAMSKNKKPIGNWIVGRYIKTFSGYWAVFIMVSIVTMIIDRRLVDVYFSDVKPFDGCFHMLLDFTGLTYFFGTTTQCKAWWYMSACIIFILIAPILYYLISHYSGLYIVLLLVLVPRILSITYPGKIYSLIIPYCIGMIFAKRDFFNVYYQKFSGKKKWVLSLILILLLNVIAFYVYDKLEFKKYWDLARGFLAIPLFLLIVCYVIRIPIVGVVLDYIGKNSLNIFLIHVFIKSTYLREFTYSFRNTWLILLVLLVISLALSVIINLILKYSQYNRLMDYLGRKVDQFRI